MEFLKDLDIGVIAIQFAVLLFSLSIHEASHAWMADRLGDSTARYLGRVTINPIPHIDPIGTVLFPLLQFIVHFPLIGWAKPVPINPIHLRNPKRDNMLISLAGPGANLFAGVLAFALLAVLKVSLPASRNLIELMVSYGVIVGTGVLSPILGILYYGMTINLLLAIFNLIPIPPLDGHWILSGILPDRAGAALEKAGSYGFVLLYALVFVGAFQFLLVPVEFVRGLLHSF